MTVRPFRDGDEEHWRAFVGARPESRVGHRIEWRSVLAESFGHRPRYLIAEREGRIAGVLPLVRVEGLVGGRALVSLPWLDDAGPLAEDADTERALLRRAVEIGREERCRYVEIRSLRDLGEPRPVREGKTTLLLELDDPERMWNGFPAKVRNQIRKAEKEGLVAESGGAELLDPFYRVFSRNMRDIGVPVWGRDFFKRMAAAFGPSMEVIVVREEGETPVGGCVLLRHGETAVVPSASSLRDRFRLCPNHLLYWTAIRRAREGGASVFDFGRSTAGSGTYRFKKQWGAAPVPCRWHYALLRADAVPERSTASRKLRLFVEAWKRLPLPLARWLGPVIVRRIP
ncbi:MAG: FemAB family PEP-CTERM system-associated protein [Candidatus Eisenbacteria bacterium]|nr:FemAB family PEP-CTERM system-associated protein [Candidatus Eisenbacteria bacterium]